MIQDSVIGRPVCYRGYLVTKIVIYFIFDKITPRKVKEKGAKMHLKNRQFLPNRCPVQENHLFRVS